MYEVPATLLERTHRGREPGTTCYMKRVRPGVLADPSLLVNPLKHQRCGEYYLILFYISDYSLGEEVNE